MPDIPSELFRRGELELIALNDERRGGLWTPDEYKARRLRILKQYGITEGQLEVAKVFQADRHGHGPELELNWDQLRYRRRARGEEGT